MKILQINTRYLGGGGAAYIANLLHTNINSLEEYESMFLYGRGQQGDSFSNRIIIKRFDYLSALSFRLFSKEINFNNDLEKYIIEADIVHLHNIHGYYIDYKRLFFLLAKYDKKIVWTLHDMWPLTGRCAYSFGCDEYKRECGKCVNLSSYPKTFIDRSKKNLRNKKNIIEKIKEKNLIIVTPSLWLSNICKETYLNKYRIVNIPNGIEHQKVIVSKQELRIRYNIDINKKVILFVAADTNDERKGIKYILDIIPECSNYLFVSFGKELKNINYENFIQLGYINDRQKINEVYKLADIFVIPSLDDNFPTTVIESFANSTPVIGFNQGGIPEQISEGLGTIVSKFDSKELKKQLIKLVENEQILNIYSENCNKKFYREYSIETFINRYIDLYEEMIKL